MIDNRERTKDSPMGLIGAGTIGLMIGAAGSLAAIAFYDKENRKKVQHTVNEVGKKFGAVRKQAMSTLDNVRGKAENMTRKAQNQLEDVKQKASIKVEETKRSSAKMRV